MNRSVPFARFAAVVLAGCLPISSVWAQSAPSTAPQESRKSHHEHEQAVDSGELSASDTKLRLGPTDPTTAPTGLPKNRPVIGLALGVVRHWP